MSRLEGKVAVITGAGGGLGRAMGTWFAREGASVVCQDLNEDAARGTVEAIAGTGGPEAMAWACDVTDSAAIDEMFDALTDRYGPCNVLVNNAGVDHTPDDAAGDIAEMSDAGWQRMMDIHLNGAFYCSRAMIKRLRAVGQGGSIICMSSIAGLSGWGPVHYATAKGGLLGLVRSIARFNGGQGIRANAICPGVIDTPMTQAISDELLMPLKMMTPLGRVGVADDIAAAAVYLASDESSFVTGQALSPNGGLVI